MGTHVIQSYLKIYQAKFIIYYYNRFKILMYDIYEYKFNISCNKTDPNKPTR